MRKRRTLNPKRRLQEPPATEQEHELLAQLAAGATYWVYPEHKRDPGDFNVEALARRPPCYPTAPERLPPAEVGKVLRTRRL